MTVEATRRSSGELRGVENLGMDRGEHAAGLLMDRVHLSERSIPRTRGSTWSMSFRTGVPQLPAV